MIGSKNTFTIGEVAQLADVPEKSVRLAIRRGELVARRFNSRLVRVERAAVENWLEECKVRARLAVVRVKERSSKAERALVGGKR